MRDGYSLVFEGRVMPGFDRSGVIARVSRRLGRDPENISRLFQDKAVIVRKGLDREKAVTQQQIYARMGVSCRVEPPEDGEYNHSEAEAGPAHRKCPKCGNDLTKFVNPFDECPYCGIIISKYLKIRQRSSPRA